MADKIVFIEDINKGYTFKGESVQIGAAILDGEVIKEAGVFLPLKTMNRHGLIAGATGTGKTKTLQMISEFLSELQVRLMTNLQSATKSSISPIPLQLSRANYYH